MSSFAIEIKNVLFWISLLISGLQKFHHIYDVCAFIFMNVYALDMHLFGYNCVDKQQSLFAACCLQCVIKQQNWKWGKADHSCDAHSSRHRRSMRRCVDPEENTHFISRYFGEQWCFRWLFYTLVFGVVQIVPYDGTTGLLSLLNILIA